MAGVGHEKVGHTSQGLWHHKGWQLPAYIQHVANDLIASGHSESHAIELAVGIIKNWAHGHDGHGHKVTAETQTKAAAALAEWEALKAAASHKQHRSTGAGMADTKKPYGDVTYADPGYQKDGKKRYPIDTAAHVKAAWSYINQSDNASQYSSENLAKIKGRIKAAAKKVGVEISDDSGSSRAEDLALPDWSSEFIRSVALDDIHIRSGGTGRTVEAYCAIFDQPAEIMDQDGHYYEVNSRNAWNQTIRQHQGRFPIVYHHGMTLAGTPSDRGSVPIGVSTEVRPDSKGVLTVGEYARSELADEVLESVRIGAVTAQSYGGRFVKSDPNRRPHGGFRAGADGRLRTVTRLEVAMREFGPTPFPAFANATITGIRAQQVLGALMTAPADQRLALLNQFTGLTTPLEPEAPAIDTPDAGDVELTDEAQQHSARSIPLRTRIDALRIARGWELPRK